MNSYRSVYIFALVSVSLAISVLSAPCQLKKEPEWATWEQVNASAIDEIEILALESLLEYTQALEELSKDLVCVWDGVEIEFEDACRKPEQDDSRDDTRKYAVRFSYSVPCLPYRPDIEDDYQDDDVLTLSGLIEGSISSPPAAPAPEEEPLEALMTQAAAVVVKKNSTDDENLI